MLGVTAETHGASGGRGEWGEARAAQPGSSPGLELLRPARERIGSLGDLQHLVLLAVLRLEAGAYGAAIRDEIQATGGRELSLGAIYSALRRLEDQGLLTARKGDPRPVKGGRARTFFDVTPEGLTALRGAQRELRRMLDGLTGLPLTQPQPGGDP